MGKVCLVEDLVCGNSCLALKQIPQTAIGIESVRSFRKEFEAMTRLKHPNLVRVYDFGHDSSHQIYYITMEYVEGVSLREHVVGNGVLTIEQAIALLVDLCRALSFIHSRAIVHRDISPGNIMHSSQDSFKLMDFGLADVDMPDKKRKGTMESMAPEVLNGNSDMRTDIFSLGLTLWYGITGEKFYSDDSPQAIIDLLKNPLSFNTHVQERLLACQNQQMRHIIERLIRFEPGERFQSCTEIINRINLDFKTAYPLETAQTKEAYVLGAGFVGREEEFACIKNRIDTKELHTRALWVLGDAGVGKSRLFAEFKHYCQLNEIVFLEGSCYEYIHKPFGPFLPIVSELLLWADDSFVEQFGQDLKIILPDHQRLVSTEMRMLEDKQTEHLLIVKAIVRCIVTCSKRYMQGCVLYCNDMHWSDAGSAEVIDRLLQEIANAYQEKAVMPALVVYLSSRREGKAVLEKMKQADQIDTMIVESFTAPAVRSYVESVFGAPLIGPRLLGATELIHNRAEGNAFFLQEIIKSLILNDYIVRGNEHWELVDDLSHIHIPHNLDSLISSRLEKLALSLSEQRVLNIIALFSRAISPEELNDIVTVPPDLLEKLEHKEVITVHQRGQHTFYTIAHDLMRQTICNTISEPALLHEYIAQRLEQTNEKFHDSIIEDCAYHFLAANNPVKAIPYIRLVIKNKEKNCENDNTLEWYDKLIALYTEKENSDKIDLLYEKSMILYYTGKIELSIQTIEQAEELAHKENDIKKEAHMCAQKGLVFLCHGTLFKKAGTVLEKALKLFDSIDDKEGLAETYNYLGYYYFHSYKKYDKAIEYNSRGTTIAETINNQRHLADNLVNVSQSFHAKGQFDLALEYVKKGTILHEALELKRDRALDYGLTGFYYFCKEDYTRALEYLGKELALTEEGGYLGCHTLGLVKKAEVMLKLQQYHVARALSDEIEELLEYIATDWEAQLMGTILVAKISFIFGQRKKGINCLEELLKKCDNQFEIAKLNYELWLMSLQEHYRDTARTMYREITRTTPDDYIFNRRLKDLEQGKAEENIYEQSIFVEDESMENIAVETQVLIEQLVETEDPFTQRLDPYHRAEYKKSLQNKCIKLARRLTGQLYQSTQHQSLVKEIHRNASFQKLLTTIRTMNRSVNVKVLLQQILDASIDLLQAERGAILLCGDNKNFTVALAGNNKHESIDSAAFSVPSAVMARLKMDHQPLFIPDLITDDGFSVSRSIADMELRSIMYAPMQVSKDSPAFSNTDNELLGVIYLDSKSISSEQGFAGSNIELLKTLADQASVALYNSILREDLEKLIKEKNAIMLTLEQEVGERRIAEEQIRHLNEHLEQKIQERTAELVAAQKKVVENAYKAGMADIAAELLHNTGNVINSAMTSCQIMEQTLGESSINDLLKANDLLRDNIDTIDDFIVNDPKGHKLLRYYLSIGDAVKEEYELLSQHLQRIKEKQKTISQIVTSQHVPKSHSVNNAFSITAMLDEILDLMKHLFYEKRIDVEKNYSGEAIIRGQQFKIRHIFMNLIMNACEAMAHTPPHMRVLNLSVVDNQDGNVLVSVKDYGKGIDEKIQDIIFSQGFSTKHEHYGISLHSCANYMKEIGGYIEVFSEGTGKGATFVLHFRTLQKNTANSRIKSPGKHPIQ